MSWEAWGDDDAGSYDHLYDAGWVDGDEAREMRGKLLALSWERMVLMAAYDMPPGAFEKAMLYSEADGILYGAREVANVSPQDIGMQRSMGEKP